MKALLYIPTILAVTLVSFQPRPLPPPFAITVSCGGRVTADVDDCEASEKPTATAAMLAAVEKFFGDVQLKCSRCTPPEHGCNQSAGVEGGSTIIIDQLDNGNYYAVICPGGEDSKVFFECSSCI